MSDTSNRDIDEYRAWSENGTDQCPYCGEGIKATDTVLTVEGKETVPAATNSVAESLYHPDCYADREAEIRNDENRSLTDFLTDGGETPGHGGTQTHNQQTKVDAVTTWNDPDEIGERVVRYRDVRCPECGRMFWCIRWEAVGWPEVHCDACDYRDTWPFDETGLRERYEEGPRYVK